MSMYAKSGSTSKITHELSARGIAEEKDKEDKPKASESSGELEALNISKAENGFTARSSYKGKADTTKPSKEHVFNDAEKLLEHVRGELGCKSAAE